MNNKYFFNTCLIYISICLIVFIIGSITIPLMEIDSVQYANISREMLLTKNFLQIYDQNKDYLDKPPLLFWISSLFMYVFGINDFNFRLPSILIAILAIYSTYKFANLYYSKQISILASLILASSQAMFLITHDVRTDTMLMGWVIYGIWQYAKWLKFQNISSFILSSSAFAFGMMTKGPIALMVPIFAFFPHLILKKQYKLLLRWEYIMGFFIIFVLLIPMNIGLYQQFDLHPEKELYGRNGTSGLKFFYWTQSFGRITGESVWHENGYFTFLFENLLWGFLPWIVFFIISLILEIKNIYNNIINSQSEIICISGFIITYCALGISHYQLPHYIYIVLPFISILTAKYIYSFINNQNNLIFTKIIKYIHFLLYCIILILLAYLILIPFPNHSFISLFFLIFVLIFFIYVILKKKIKLPFYLNFGLFTIITTNFLLNIFFYPSLLEYQLGNQVTKFIQLHNIRKNSFYLYNVYNERSLDFYSNFSFKNITNLDLLKKSDYVLVDQKSYFQIKDKNFELMKNISSFHVSTLNFSFLNPTTRNKELTHYYILQKN